MVNTNQLESMSRQNVETINREILVDIFDIHIRQNLPNEEKILDFINQIKNPYCFQCGNVPVKVCFTDNGPKFSQALQDYFIHIKQG